MIVFFFVSDSDYHYLRTWESMQENWAVDSVGHVAFRGLRNVITELKRCPIFFENIVVVEPLDGIAVLHS